MTDALATPAPATDMPRPWLAHYPPGVPATVPADAYPSVVALLEESPLPLRGPIDYLIDRYESLRTNCLN